MKPPTNTPAGKSEEPFEEQLARQFHEVYERLAPSFGYETRKDTKKFDPTQPNGRLMMAVCAEIFAVASAQLATLQRELAGAREDFQSFAKIDQAANSELTTLRAQLEEAKQDKEAALKTAQFRFEAWSDGESERDSLTAQLEEAKNEIGDLANSLVTERDLVDTLRVQVAKLRDSLRDMTIDLQEAYGIRKKSPSEDRRLSHAIQLVAEIGSAYYRDGSFQQMLDRAAIDSTSVPRKGTP